MAISRIPKVSPFGANFYKLHVTTQKLNTVIDEINDEVAFIDGSNEFTLVDLGGNADALVLDADGDTSISAPTDDQIDIEIGGFDDFVFVANIFRALSGSSIETNTINETTAANGVSIDSVLLKDGGVVIPAQAGAGGPANAISSANSGKTLVHLDDAGGNGYFEVTTDNYGFADAYFWIADATADANTAMELNLHTREIVVTDDAAAQQFVIGKGYVEAKAKVIMDGTTTSSGAGAVAITGSIHEVTTTGTGDALTLADGTEGQHLIVVYVAEGAGADTAVLTPTNLAGASTTITFNAIGDSAHLLFTAGTWFIVGQNGVTVA